jgi:hypothetical protein
MAVVRCLIYLAKRPNDPIPKSNKQRTADILRGQPVNSRTLDRGCVETSVAAGTAWLARKQMQS